MTGVDAHADALGLVETFDDEAQLLERPAERRAGARRVLEQDARLDPRGAPHRVIQAAGDGLEAPLGSSTHVGAGMEDQGPDSEGVTATQLLNERTATLVSEVAIGAREVDEVRAVRDDGTDTARRHRAPKASDLLQRQSARAPLDLISGEDLDDLGVDAPTALGSLVQPSGRRHVRSEEHQWPVGEKSEAVRAPVRHDPQGARSGEYREYLTDEQRSGRGCIGGLVLSNPRLQAT